MKKTAAPQNTGLLEASRTRILYTAENKWFEVGR